MNNVIKHDDPIKIDIFPAYIAINPFFECREIYNISDEINTIKCGMTWVCEQFVLKLQNLEDIKDELKYKKIGGDFFIGGKYAIEFLYKDSPLGCW